MLGRRTSQDKRRHCIMTIPSIPYHRNIAVSTFPDFTLTFMMHIVLKTVLTPGAQFTIRETQRSPGLYP